MRRGKDQPDRFVIAHTEIAALRDACENRVNGVQEDTSAAKVLDKGHTHPIGWFERV
ncbi:hypothetical protein HRbin36_02317 [bacterium HR36]|nr:hypothetical protein HRbin36_02317 [bacterium HR36]